MSRVGYARVSRVDQHPEAQRERLLAAGCDPDLVFTDHGVSGARASRPEWDRCLAQLRKGDVLVAVRLDRIGRSLRNLLDVVKQLDERGVNLEILDQGLRTDTPAGRMIFSIMAALAEYERELIIERTKDGLAATSNRGRGGGRPSRLTDAQVAKAKQLREQGHSMSDIGQMLGNGKPVSRTVLYRALGMTSDDARGAKKA